MKNKILILICCLLFIVTMFGAKICLDNANNTSISDESIKNTIVIIIKILFFILLPPLEKDYIYSCSN